MKALIPGLVLFTLVLVRAQTTAQTEISIQELTNVADDSVLTGGSTHTLTLRFTATGAPPGRSYLTANGFRIYSPDGADWTAVQGTALTGFSQLDWDHVFVSHFNKTGGSGTYGMPLSSGGGNASGHDTVVILLAGVNARPGGGLPGGFDDAALAIEFSSRREDAGLHICIDTCLSAPGASWEWAHPDGLIQPSWGGVRCFVIGCCNGRVGDVNGAGGDEPTISDISALIDLLFISQTRPDCLEECDVNLSGTLNDPPLDWGDVTISDISYLIDYLFLEHTPLPDCP
jgi:hypothetical protein